MRRKLESEADYSVR